MARVKSFMKEMKAISKLYQRAILRPSAPRDIKDFNDLIGERASDYTYQKAGLGRFGARGKGRN